jgi:hypothetical protein
MCSETAAGDSLFSAERVPLGPIERWLASDYERLDRAMDEIPVRVRGLMDAWYARLPDHARSEIRQRFTEKTMGAHLGAFWELYLHEAGCRLGCEVDIDVGRDHAGRRPDLLLCKAATSFYVEARVAEGDDVIAREQRTRANQLYAAVERITNRDFLIFVSLMRVGANTPGSKLVTTPLDHCLARLDPDAERRRTDAGDAPAELLIDRDGWRVRLQATAKLPENRGRPDTTVIGGREEGFADDPDGEDLLAEVDDIAPLTRALLRKAGHGYELGERPFVIAALCAGPLVDDHDIAQALFGPIGYRLSVSSNKVASRYLPGGLWHEGAGVRYRDVSAVLTASNVHPGNVASVEPCLWLNPAATRPLDAPWLPWLRREIGPDGRLAEHPASASAAGVFGLPRQWPAAD